MTKAKATKHERCPLKDGDTANRRYFPQLDTYNLTCP